MAYEVKLNPCIAVPGQEAVPHSAVYHPVNVITDGSLGAGEFAFIAEGHEPKGAFDPLMVSNKGKGAPLGLVPRTIVAGIDPLGDAAKYNVGQEIGIARRGDFYIAATGKATVGQAVKCDPSNGKVSFGKTGEANDTGWVVMTAAEKEGDLIIISNRGIAVAPQAA